MNLSKKLGENLKRLRLKKKLSQGDLSKSMAVNRAYISNIEKATLLPDTYIPKECSGDIALCKSAVERFGSLLRAWSTIKDVAQKHNPLFFF